ncbi:hypothetical protein IWQ62_002226 [Dispira parvispora]|uniref:DNA replication checkpoint mediator MRC1 domain-containing protein n=1 Tax=Dispira parvispora TaxID=1520584 RepID=A0A9W8AQT6_9FUNG|nr:hypothetical protein IWQ62_002226 [Dispira parvispora]
MEDNVSSPVQVQSASKKELLEMHRESEQLIRSAPVAMRVRVNKKLTMGNFLARFQQKQAPVTNEPLDRKTAESSLPPSPSKQETLTSTATADRMTEADTSDNPTVSSKSLSPPIDDHPLKQTTGNDSDSEFELEIVENETTLIKQKRCATMASLLTGVNRYQPQLTSPEKCNDPPARKPSRFQSPQKNSKESVIPIGVDHRQLNALLTRRILEQSAQKRQQELALAESTPSNAATAEVGDENWSGEEDEGVIVSNDAEAECNHSDSEKVSPAPSSPVNDETDTSSDEDCDLVLPTRQTRKLVVTNSPPPSPGKSSKATANQPLFPLFSRVKPPTSSINRCTTSAATDTFRTVDTDATLSITPTTHGLLAQGAEPPSVTTPAGDSEGNSNPPPITTSKTKSHQSNTEWFDAECFTNIPSPSEDSLFEESDLLLHPAVSNGVAHASTGFDPDALDPSQQIELDSSQRPLTTLVISDDDNPDTIQDRGEGTPVIDDPGSPTQALTISTATVPFTLTPTQPLLDEESSPTPNDARISLITASPTAEPSPPPVRLNRLKRRKDMRPEDLPNRKKAATLKPRSAFVDAEAEEGVSDDELGPDEPFGKQLLLSEFNNQSEGNPVGSQQPPHANDGEECDEDRESLDEWDENDSMIAFSGDDEDEDDPEAIRQLHQQREATDDANAVATLYRDISDGRLLDRSLLRRRQQAGYPGQGDRVDLMDWVEGEDVIVNADQERRRLMWKRGLRLGKEAAEREEDEAHTKLCKLAEHPDTAAFARSALALDMIEAPIVPMDASKGVVNAQTDQDTDDDKEEKDVASTEAPSISEDGGDISKHVPKRTERLSSAIARKQFSAIRSGSVGDFRITRESASQSAFVNATPPPVAYDPLDFLDKPTQSALDVSTLLTKRTGIYKSSASRKNTGFNHSSTIDQEKVNPLSAPSLDSNPVISTLHSRSVKNPSVKKGPSETALDDFSVTRETRLRRFLPEKNTDDFLTTVSLTSSNKSITTFSSTADQTNASVAGHSIKVKGKFS